MDEFLEKFNDRAAQDTFTEEDIRNHKILAVIGYIFPIIFFVLTLQNKESSYCRFHANQQLAWLITGIAAGVVSTILGFIPILGIIIKLVISLGTLAVMICLAVGASKDMALKLPIIGDMINVF